jgi:hypothetical protein
LQKVAKPLQHSYQGDLVTIETSDGDEIVATGNHPFWVVEGADLANRQAAQHVPSNEQVITMSGRWIDARELRAGDQLLTHLGMPLAILNLYATEVVVQVYNLEVEGHHNYAVGHAGILVHNRTDGNEGFGGGGGASRPLPPIIYREGNPNPGNLTPRPTDEGVLSFRDSLSNPITPGHPGPPGGRPVFRPGEPYIAVDTSQLPAGSVIPDDNPPGHVGVIGVPPEAIKPGVIPKPPGPPYGPGGSGKFPK